MKFISQIINTSNYSVLHLYASPTIGPDHTVCFVIIIIIIIIINVVVVTPPVQLCFHPRFLQSRYLYLMLLLLLFSWRYNPYGCIFYSPVAGFSLLVFRGFLITHNDAPQSVGLLWTSDQSVAEISPCTTHNTHNRQTSMPPVGFEPTILAGERPKTYALDHLATGTGVICSSTWKLKAFGI